MLTAVIKEDSREGGVLTAVIKEDSREGGAECSDKGRQQGGGC